MSMVLTQELMQTPFYELSIDGTKIDDDLKKYITLVEFEESDTVADLVRISISDADFKFANNTNLMKRAPLRLLIGVGEGAKAQVRAVFSGNISHIEGDFSEDGIPTIVLCAIDKSNVMTTKKKSRKWTKKKSSDVVIAIAKDYGLNTSNVKVTPYVIDEITQEDETDAEILNKLADDEAFQWFIMPNENKIFFGDVFDTVRVQDEIFWKKGDYSIQTFSPTYVEKDKPEKAESTESDVSKTTGNKVSSTTKGSTASKTSNNGSSKSKSNTTKKAGSKGSSSQKNSQVGVNTSTGKVTKRKR